MPDKSSPGFVVEVAAQAPVPTLTAGGKPPSRSPSRPGVPLARMTDVSARVSRFEHVEEDGPASLGSLKLTVDNWDLYFFDHPAWIPGNLVRFFWGYPGKIQGPKNAVVSSIRGFQKLEITCVEQAALSNERKNRKWENTTREQIAAALVAEGAFPGVAKIAIGAAQPINVFTKSVDGDVDAAASATAAWFEAISREKPRAFSQSQETDWEFVSRLGWKVGYQVYVDEDTLYFRPRRLDRAPTRSFEWFTGSGELLSFDVAEWRVLDRAGTTTVSGRDPVTGKNFSATGSNETTDRYTLGRAGSSAMMTALKPGGDGRLRATRVEATPNPDPAHAENAADAQFRADEHGELECTATVIGDPDLRRGKVVEIKGISSTLSGNFYVRGVRHTIDAHGYRTEMTLLRNALSRIASSSPAIFDPETAKTNDQKPTGRRIQAGVVGDLRTQ